MTIKNFDALATLIDGNAIKLPEDKDVTYQWLIVEALSTAFQDEPNLSGVEKYKRGELIKKILAGGDIDLKIEELSLIKSLVGKRWPVQFVYQIYNLLEDKE